MKNITQPKKWQMKLTQKMVLLYVCVFIAVFGMAGNILYLSATQTMEAINRQVILTETQMLQNQLDILFVRILQTLITIAGLDEKILQCTDHTQLFKILLETMLNQDPTIMDIYTAYEKGIVDGRDYKQIAYFYNAARKNTECSRKPYQGRTHITIRTSRSMTIFLTKIGTPMSRKPEN